MLQLITTSLINHEHVKYKQQVFLPLDYQQAIETGCQSSPKQNDHVSTHANNVLFSFG